MGSSEVGPLADLSTSLFGKRSREESQEGAQGREGSQLNESYKASFHGKQLELNPAVNASKWCRTHLRGLLPRWLGSWGVYTPTCHQTLVEGFSSGKEQY